MVWWLMNDGGSDISLSCVEWVVEESKDSEERGASEGKTAEMFSFSHDQKASSFILIGVFLSTKETDKKWYFFGKIPK